jgi:hypothetical protein
MSTTENVQVKALRGVADPVERAAACQRFIANGRATLKAIQQLRDEAIQSARQANHPGAKTVDGLASAVGVRRNVVVDALRGSE